MALSSQRLSEMRYHADVVVNTPDVVLLLRDSSAWLDRCWPLASRPHSPISWSQGEMALLWTSIGRFLVAELHINSMSVAGFRTLFLVNGPNSSCAHSATLALMENHVDLILKVAKPWFRIQEPGSILWLL